MPPVAGLAERGGRAPTPPLYKEGRGMASRILVSLPPLASASSFHSPWRKGIRVPRRWRRGSPLDSAPLLLLSPWWWNRSRGEGGGGEAGAEVAVLREEEDGAARRLPPRQWCLSRW